jgi:predicted transcriptional regulator
VASSFLSSATAQSILDILSVDPYLKREEIAARAGLKLEGLMYQLAQLQKKGYLLRIEGRKTGRWKVLIKK